MSLEESLKYFQNHPDIEINNKEEHQLKEEFYQKILDNTQNLLKKIDFNLIENINKNFNENINKY